MHSTGSNQHFAISMFCVQSQNCQHCFETMKTSMLKQVLKLENVIKSSLDQVHGSWVIDQNIQILFYQQLKNILTLMSFLSFSDIFCYKMLIKILQISVDHKFWDSAQNMLNFGLRCNFHLKVISVILSIISHLFHNEIWFLKPQ